MFFMLTPVFWILAAVTIISLIAAAIVWKKRTLPGGASFFYMMIAISFYAFVAAMEAVTVPFNVKLFWATFEHLGVNMTVVLFVIFTAEYTGKAQWFTKKYILFYPIIPFLLAATNHFHHWVWNDFSISQSVQNMIIFHHGLAYYLTTGIIYLLLIHASIILIISGYYGSVLQRRQTRLLIFSTFSPWIFSLVYILDLSPLPGLNLIPVSFLLSGIIIILAFFQTKLLHLVPIARDQLLDIMWEGMIVTDIEFRIVDINSNTLNLFNVKINDVLGNPISELIEIENTLHELNKNQKSIKCNHQIKDNKQTYYFEIHSSPVHNKFNDLIGYIFVLHDITKRKLNEQEREKLIVELQQANETKNRFFSIISHDLKNPFITISSYVQLIRENFDDLPKDELISLTDELYLSIKNTNAFLENLLDWSRSQTGTLKFKIQPEPVITLADSVLEIIRPQANQKNIRIMIDIPDDLWVNTDANLTCTVLRNLLSNAIKFTNENGNITIKAFLSEDTVHMQVIDDGIGVDPLIIKDLFHLDKTVTTSGTQDERGSGLGLILCKEFIEKQGGIISVESNPGKGSTFSFTLPKADPNIK